MKLKVALFLMGVFSVQPSMACDPHEGYESLKDYSAVMERVLDGSGYVARFQSLKEADTKNKDAFGYLVQYQLVTGEGSTCYSALYEVERDYGKDGCMSSKRTVTKISERPGCD